MPQILRIPKAEDRVVPLIRALAANADRVFFVEHAEQRMMERGITRPQIIECLRHGTVSEPPHQDAHGNWRCTLEHITCGDRVRTVASPDEGRLLVIVITTF
ncbi:DUF4258 domain-containing protein [Acidithiobacillus sp. CV18-2]|nr:DUF4258 domain-containing protein [Acidithiobacillus sp. CV18-3]MBU2756895.1 DUF4258 domain-containing protein [Acidithiobacillus sp. BN09-2]MBU2778007.1 DUF4258 domain-containing protein [Acidithiobacillus sp. CV18-2]MBU2799606.1 DUF4258 domain-containing protein [Acidithiobacillus sp. VAN18-4]